MLMEIINTSFDNIFNVITYHFKLCDSLQIFNDELSHRNIFEPDFIYTEIDYISRLTLVGKDIVNILLKIPGVKTFTIKSSPGRDKYVLQIYIENIFSHEIIQDFINVYNQSMNSEIIFNKIHIFNQTINDNEIIYKFSNNRIIDFYFKRNIIKNCIRATSLICDNNKILFDYSSRYITQKNIIKRKYTSFFKKLYNRFHDRIYINVYRNKINISFILPNTVRDRYEILSIAQKELNVSNLTRIY